MNPTIKIPDPKEFILPPLPPDIKDFPPEKDPPGKLDFPERPLFPEKEDLRKAETPPAPSDHKVYGDDLLTSDDIRPGSNQEKSQAAIAQKSPENNLYAVPLNHLDPVPAEAKGD